MFSVYLAGYISGNKIQECLDWRKKVRDHYNNWKKPIYKEEMESLSSVDEYCEWLLPKDFIQDGNKVIVGYKKEPYPIIWLDPLNGQVFDSITGNGLKSSLPSTAFPHRDYACVKQANLLVVNMDTFGEKRPLTGTIYELAWTWLDHKPCIIITQDENYKNHPFIRSTASMIVDSVDEMLDKKLINYFYKGTVSAEY